MLTARLELSATVRVCMYYCGQGRRALATQLGLEGKTMIYAWPYVATGQRYSLQANDDTSLVRKGF